MRRSCGRVARATALVTGLATVCSILACGGRISTSAPSSPIADQVVTGPFEEREVAQACAFGSQCASRVCSAAGSGCGQCMNVAKLGATCGGLTACHPGATCREGRCESTKKLGGYPCELGPKLEDMGECDLEFFCSRSQGGANPAGQCEKRHLHGEACDATGVPCPWTDVCLKGICTKRATGSLGDACEAFGAGDECGEGTFCDHEADVCRANALPEGAICGLTNAGFTNGECVVGTVCGDIEHPNGGGPDRANTCLPLPGEGAPCMNSRCSAGAYCRNLPTATRNDPVNRCERLAKAGEKCDRTTYYGVECERGLECRAGLCEPACR